MPSRSDIEHLLRRTEYVARPKRVSQLLAKPDLEAAVDDILDVPADPGSATLTEDSDWSRGVELTHFWLDRMAHDSPRPMQEKMAFFWHGHFCSSLSKVGNADQMRAQIDLFRRSALGNVRSVAIKMSTQVAMLRYLDNNRNQKTSPNQNFARELMELFLLGVGNYTEPDVEAATAAWTGHTDDWRTHRYVWREDWHDARPKQFLGRRINDGTPSTRHGAETIEVMLGSGVIPTGAADAANRGRASREVAAEFLSHKLWAAFAGTATPAPVLAAMRDALVHHDFAIRPWVRTMLLRPEFYTAEVRRGLVRSPVEFGVACLVATGRRSVVGSPLYLFDGMGQRPLYPPNVDGWKHNEYWINASAMAKRTHAARSVIWRCMEGFWNGDGLIRLANGNFSKPELSTTYKDRPEALVDHFLDLLGLALSPPARTAVVTASESLDWWERTDLLALILLAPEFHMA